MQIKPFSFMTKTLLVFKSVFLVDFHHLLFGDTKYNILPEIEVCNLIFLKLCPFNTSVNKEKS